MVYLKKTINFLSKLLIISESEEETDPYLEYKLETIYEDLLRDNLEEGFDVQTYLNKMYTY